MYKHISGTIQHLMDTEENWYKYNPRTIPGVLYISEDKNNMKIGNNKRWSLISYIGDSTIPEGTLIYNMFKTVPSGWFRLDGTLQIRSLYRKLFDRAESAKMIISEHLWQSDPIYQGYFSYSDDDLKFRLPRIDSIMLKAWTDGCDRSASIQPGEYQHGTLLSTDITESGKMLYGVQLSDIVNAATAIGLDQPLKSYGASSTRVSGIVEKGTKQGSAVGSMRPETLSYPLYIKY